MEEGYIEAIRDTKRKQVFFNRKQQKEGKTDERRPADLRSDLPDITAIINKLKTKASISASDLKSLQNALIDDPKYIEVVLSTHGALRGLVRELTGHNVKKQIASCGCLCNLALGDAQACSVVAKAAGAYLVATLDTLTTQLAACSAWTLGNLAGSGARACDVAVSQGALAKLCGAARGGAGPAAAALYALAHLAYVVGDRLTQEQLSKITESLSEIKLDADASYLLYILSCHKDFTPKMLPRQYITKIIQKFVTSVDHHLKVCLNSQPVKFVNDEPMIDNQPMPGQQRMDQPMADQQTMDQPMADQQTMDQPMADQQTVGQPLSVDPVSSIHRNIHGVGQRSINLCDKSKEYHQKCCEYIYLVRILSNMDDSDIYKEILQCFENDITLFNNIKRLFFNDDGHSLCWLLGNILGCVGENDVFFIRLLGAELDNYSRCFD